MQKRILIFLAIIGLSAGVQAALLDDILRGEFVPETLSLREQDSILGNGEWRTANDERLSRYHLDYTDRQQLFRHSFRANYVIVDTQKGTRKPLSDMPVRDAILSPNGKYIAFVKADNNIYLHKLDFGTEVAVTSSKPEEHIFNGISDWLYEEEFATTCLMAFSPDSKQLAFVRLNDAGVPATSWQMMLGEGHPETVVQSYPRAGETNASASVHIYTIANKDIRKAQLPAEIEETDYLPRILWRTLPATDKKAEPQQRLTVLTVNRDQNKLQVFSCNPNSLVCTSFYEESSEDCFVDYALFDQWQWLSSGQFIALSEREGARRVYLHSAGGQLLKTLPVPDTDTRRAFLDYTAVYGMDEQSQTLYLQAALTPATRVCYALNLKKGSFTRIGSEQGFNSLRLSDDRKTAILSHESDREPVSYQLLTLKDLKAAPLKDNNALQQRWQSLGLPPKEFTTITIQPADAREPVSLEACIFHPRNFDASKKYPVVFLQYSGPASQRVLDTWRRRWDYALADLGCVVVIADPRGTDGKGREWRNYAYLNVGREANDQLLVAQWIADQSWADNHRIYMAGWSYGGYEVLRCLCTQSLQADGTPLITKGIAIAPVTDWRLYDSAYTERYMRRLQVNEDGYLDADLTHLAKDLKGELLIVHGNADDNVHVQNTWRFIEALINADKHYEMLIYPDDNHFLRNGNHYLHLHHELLRFLGL